MCNNYATPNRLDLFTAWGVELSEPISWAPDVWPHDAAPIIRRAQAPESEVGRGRDLVIANFGLVPFGAKTNKPSWSTMNARTETADKLWSFRGAWLRRQWCVIPAWRFYEPFYETAASKSIRWSIARADGQMMGIAGLWDRWVQPDGSDLHSFTMLTQNCDEHLLLRRFHKWFDPDGKPNEKRTPIVLRDDQYDAWLNTSVHEAKSFASLLPPDELVSVPAPVARSKSTTLHVEAVSASTRQDVLF